MGTPWGAGGERRSCGLRRRSALMEGTCSALLPQFPGEVIRTAVGVGLAVLVCVFFVVAHEVEKGEAVVAGDEVDAVVGRPARATVEVGAAGQAGGERGATPPSPLTKRRICRGTCRSTPPSAPAREAADLVEPGRVPGLGDELGVGEHGIGGDCFQEGGVGRTDPSRPGPGSRPGQSGSRPPASPSPSSAGGQDEDAEDRMVAVGGVPAA